MRSHTFDALTFKLDDPPETYRVVLLPSESTVDRSSADEAATALPPARVLVGAVAGLSILSYHPPSVRSPASPEPTTRRGPWRRSGRRSTAAPATPVRNPRRNRGTSDQPDTDGEIDAPDRDPEGPGPTT
jgi:hypothetical protein